MHFQAFDTFEDMLAAIDTALANANEVAKMHPIKIEMLLPGTKFLMVDKEAGEIFDEVIGHAGPDTDLTDEERGVAVSRELFDELLEPALTGLVLLIVLGWVMW